MRVSGDELVAGGGQQAEAAGMPAVVPTRRSRQPKNVSSLAAQ